ncbi:MAG: preprotein translocase subunit SecY [Clostridia bacterium]|nr:preprotein translocase subunit SecY [Clostridia bacterium]
MFETIKNAWKIKEIRIKILITLGLILMFRIGAFIPVAGINVEAFAQQFGAGAENLSFLNIMNSIVGGALSNGTIFAMGIGPYINASIIMQLLTVGIPRLERLQKEGEEGRKKIAQLTRYLTIVLAIVQALGILLGYKGLVDTSIFNGKVEWLLYIFIILQFAAGTTLTMWIGERITEYGVGNGISLLIFAGILATAGLSIQREIQNIIAGGAQASTSAFSLIIFLVIVIVIFALIVWVDLAERKIPVQYAKQVKGRKMYGGQSTHIPIRINASGVLPLIFAYAILSFPSLIVGMFNISGGFANWISINLVPGGWLYTILVSLLILFFAFFYAQIQFNPEDISKNIQQYGGFIPGIRPGRPTTDYLKKISNRITLFGAIFLAAIALVPSLVLGLALPQGSSLISAVSTTGLLIIVSVALEFDKQLESQIMMKHYKGFLD